MSRMSRKPAVTSIPVFAPRRSMIELVTRVVPWAIDSTSAIATFSAFEEGGRANEHRRRRVGPAW